MSAKQAILNLVQGLPETASWVEIVLALHSHTRAHPEVLGADADYEWPTPDLTDEEWMLAIAQDWADDLNDPRQDSYTFEDGTDPK